MKMFNSSGKKVATLVSQEMPAGAHTFQWNTSGYCNGIYFCRLEAGEMVDTKKFILQK
jgi:hypothetical protein